MQSAAYRGSFRLKHSPGITGRKLLFCQEPRPGRLCVYSYRTEHLAKKRKKKKKQKRKKKVTVVRRERERERWKRKYHTVNSHGRAVRASLTARRVSPAYPLRFNSIGHLHIRGGEPFLQKVAKLRRRSLPRSDTPAATC